MTHDDLTERVARAIHQAEIDYGNTDLEPFDELDESTRGLATAYANAVIPLVREDERRRVQKAIETVNPYEVVYRTVDNYGIDILNSDQDSIADALAGAYEEAIGLSEEEKADAN